MYFLAFARVSGHHLALTEDLMSAWENKGIQVVRPTSSLVYRIKDLAIHFKIF